MAVGRRTNWFRLRTEPLKVNQTLVRVAAPWDMNPSHTQTDVVPAAAATAGTTEKTVQTLSIAAQPYSYILDVAAHFSGLPDTDLMAMVARIRVDGVEKARVDQHAVGAGTRRNSFAMPTCLATTIAVNTACSVTVTITRTSGAGTFTLDIPGVVTATIYPQAA